MSGLKMCAGATCETTCKQSCVNPEGISRYESQLDGTAIDDRFLGRVALRSAVLVAFTIAIGSVVSLFAGIGIGGTTGLTLIAAYFGLVPLIAFLAVWGASTEQGINQWETLIPGRGENARQTAGLIFQILEDYDPPAELSIAEGKSTTAVRASSDSFHIEVNALAWGNDLWISWTLKRHVRPVVAFFDLLSGKTPVVARRRLVAAERAKALRAAVHAATRDALFETLAQSERLLAVETHVPTAPTANTAGTLSGFTAKAKSIADTKATKAQGATMETSALANVAQSFVDLKTRLTSALTSRTPKRVPPPEVLDTEPALLDSDHDDEYGYGYDAEEVPSVITNEVQPAAPLRTVPQPVETAPAALQRPVQTQARPAFTPFSFAPEREVLVRALREGVAPYRLVPTEQYRALDIKGSYYLVRVDGIGDFVMNARMPITRLD